MLNRYLVILTLLFIFSGCKKDMASLTNSLNQETISGKGGSSISSLSAPTNLKGTALSTSSIKLTWKDNSTNETGFAVERKTGNSNFTTISTLAFNTTTFQDNGLVEGVTYTYRIKAFNANSISYSNNANITTWVDLTTALAAYYPFNGNVNDESGNSLHLTVFGSPIKSADRFGKQNSALLFNGTTDYLYHDRSDAFLLGDNFTLTAWVYSDFIENDEDVILGTIDFPNYASAGGYQLTFENVSQGLRFNLRNNNYYIDFGYTLDQAFFGKWEMVTAVFTPTQQTIYINGTPVQTQNSAYYLVNYGGLNNFRIGANPHALDASRLFRGKIDDVRIYNRVLTQEQITYLATH